jgi:TolC family type I secretion outer membrane protein
MVPPMIPYMIQGLAPGIGRAPATWSRVAGGVIAALALSSGMGARADTLSDALTEVYASNPQIQASRAQLRAVDEKVPQALSTVRPQVQASGSLGWFHSDLPNQVVSSGNYVTQHAGLEMSQALWLGGKTQPLMDEAYNSVLKQRAALAQTEQAVFTNVVANYESVVTARVLVELNRNRKATLDAFLKATIARHDAGQVTKTDLAEADAAAAEAGANLVAAQGKLAEAEAAYRQYVGMGAPEKAETPRPPQDLPATRDEAVTAAQSDNPAVVIAWQGIKVAQAAVDVADSELSPSLFAVGAVDHAHDPLQEPRRHNDAGFLLRLVFPMYDGGAAQSRTREARQTVDETGHAFDAAREEVGRDAVDAWERRKTAQASIAALDPLIKARLTALEGVKREEAAGARTVLDVLYAEEALFRARTDLVQAQQEETLGSYALASATGRLSAEHLGLPVEHYDPAANYEAVRDRWFGSDIEPPVHPPAVDTLQARVEPVPKPAPIERTEPVAPPAEPAAQPTAVPEAAAPQPEQAVTPYRPGSFVAAAEPATAPPPPPLVDMPDPEEVAARRAEKSKWMEYDRS